MNGVATTDIGPQTTAQRTGYADVRTGNTPLKGVVYGVEMDGTQNINHTKQSILTATLGGEQRFGGWEASWRLNYTDARDRQRAARYGLSIETINETVSAAIGGQEAGDLHERGSDRRFPILVRLQSDQRDDLDAIRRITIGADHDGRVVPVALSEIADVSFVSGASFIYREQQELRAMFNCPPAITSSGLASWATSRMRSTASRSSCRLASA